MTNKRKPHFLRIPRSGFFALVVAIIGMLNSGCGPGPGDPEWTTEEIPINESSVTGKWEGAYRAEVSPGNKSELEFEQVFESDHTYKEVSTIKFGASDMLVEFEGSWKLEGEKLVVAVSKMQAQGSENGSTERSTTMDKTEMKIRGFETDKTYEIVRQTRGTMEVKDEGNGNTYKLARLE